MNKSLFTHLTTFSSLPILAKTLWHVPKYNIICRTQNHNKIIQYENECFSVLAKFHENTDEYTEKVIYSKLLAHYKNNKIEENCKYCNYSLTNTIHVKYSFIHYGIQQNGQPYTQNKIELNFSLTPGNKFISTSFHNNLPYYTQKCIENIKKQLEENIENYKLL